MIEAKESGVQGNFWLRNELKANLGYVRCCHKQIPIAASKNILESLSGHISCYIVKYQAIRLDLELSHCNSWLGQGGGDPALVKSATSQSLLLLQPLAIIFLEYPTHYTHPLQKY